LLTIPICQYQRHCIHPILSGVKRNVAKNIRRRGRNDARSVLRKMDRLVFLKKEKVTGIHLVPVTIDISVFPGNYCLIGFDVHAGAASDAAFTWLAGAGVQAC
jgi:hypothetical protein